MATAVIALGEMLRNTRTAGSMTSLIANTTKLILQSNELLFQRLPAITTLALSSFQIATSNLRSLMYWPVVPIALIDALKEYRKVDERSWLKIANSVTEAFSSAFSVVAIAASSGRARKWAGWTRLVCDMHGLKEARGIEVGQTEYGQFEKTWKIRQCALSILADLTGIFSGYIQNKIIQARVALAMSVMVVSAVTLALWLSYRKAYRQVAAA